MVKGTKQVKENTKIDTGAMSNLLPFKVFRKQPDMPLEKNAVHIFAFGDTETH